MNFSFSSLNRWLACITIIIFLSGINHVYAQQKQYKAGCIAFYNLENLFDTIDDPLTDDAEYLPDGPSKWNTERYNLKLQHMSEAIAQIGDEMVKGGPTLIGLSEMENKQVLVDLIHQPALKNAGYDIVHYDSPDKRGVDVALLYKPSVFKVTASKATPLHVSWRNDFRTRDQLVVSGLFDGEPMSVIVNHWPSRGQGPEYRAEAAKLTRHLADSLMQLDAKAKIIIMGDLNDDPIDPSLTQFLGAKGKIKDVKPEDLYNPMWQMFKDGIGSLAYKDAWNLFDQIIISQPLLGDDKSTYKLYKTKVFNRRFLIQPDGQYAGYPWRTFSGGTWTGGYSDHFPVYIFLIKEK